MRLRSICGFTLTEVMLATAIALLASGAIASVLIGGRRSATDKAVVVLAQRLNTAMGTYSFKVWNAETLWAAAATDEAKYAELRGKGLLPQSASNWAGYVPNGYTLTFPATLTETVTVVTPNPGSKTLVGPDYQ